MSDSEYIKKEHRIEQKKFDTFLNATQRNTMQRNLSIVLRDNRTTVITTIIYLLSIVYTIPRTAN